MKHRTWFLVGVASLVLSAPSFADFAGVNKAEVPNQQANSTIVKEVQKGARVVVRRPAARPVARPVARSTTVVATPAPSTTAVVKTPTTTVVKTPNAAVVRTPAPRTRVRVVR